VTSVRQQLDAQQLGHLSQIADAAGWSLSGLSEAQQAAVVATLGISQQQLARFLEEEGAGGPRGVKRGLDRQ
jgi:hypothetical protein